MRSRQTHWDDKHGKRSTPLPCEICGKTYIDLKKHMEYHLKLGAQKMLHKTCDNVTFMKINKTGNIF